MQSISMLLTMNKFVKVKRNNFSLIHFKKTDEVKFRIINIVKKRGNNYYPPRSYKVVSLINRFEKNKLEKCTLGGCIFEKRKNLLHVSRESK